MLYSPIAPLVYAHKATRLAATRNASTSRSGNDTGIAQPNSELLLKR